MGKLITERRMHQIDVSDTMLTSKDIFIYARFIRSKLLFYTNAFNMNLLFYKQKKSLPAFKRQKKQLCKNYKQLVSILQEEVKKMSKSNYTEKEISTKSSNKP